MDIDRQNLLNNDLYGGQSWAPVVERSTGGQAPVVVPLQGTPPPLVLPRPTGDDFHRWIPRVLTFEKRCTAHDVDTGTQTTPAGNADQTTVANDDGRQAATDAA